MRELSLLSGDVADPVGAVKQLRWNVTWREMPCVFVAVVDDERTRALSADLARRGMNVTRLVAGTSQFDALFDGGSATTDGDRA